MDTRGKMALIMLQLAAKESKIENLVDDAINALQQFKATGYKEKDKPVVEVQLLAIKLIMDEKLSMSEIFARADKLDMVSHLMGDNEETLN